MRLFNSLTRKVEEFEPIDPPNVSLYTCGMTVYDYAHIGHGLKYVIDDVLRRTLTEIGYKVKHVQNVTDVGHLVSDADEGEDKLEKGARKSGKDVWQVAKYFEDHFYNSMDQLNILRPDIICKATDHIKEQIELVKTLVDKGFAYDTPEAVYFDISKYEGYENIFSQRGNKLVAVRREVKKGKDKKHPHDFALWFKRVGRFKDHIMHWDSPWGDGFPGWHIECSAMCIKYLGEQIDIHTGGEDHLFPHHPNEIAQSESATGKKPFSRFWIHVSFLKVDGRKMSKSLENCYTIDDVVNKGYSPLSLRYLFLTSNYKDPLNFTWESLNASQNALLNLQEYVYAAKKQVQRSTLSKDKMTKVKDYSDRFYDAMQNNLDTPRALSVFWEALKSNIPSEDKYDLAINFDKILGLDLINSVVKRFETKIPGEVVSLVEEREKYRKSKNYSQADKIRDKILSLGYIVKDTNQGPKLVPST